LTFSLAALSSVRLGRVDRRPSAREPRPAQEAKAIADDSRFPRYARCSGNPDICNSAGTTGQKIGNKPVKARGRREFPDEICPLEHLAASIGDGIVVSLKKVRGVHALHPDGPDRLDVFARFVTGWHRCFSPGCLRVSGTRLSARV